MSEYTSLHIDACQLIVNTSSCKHCHELYSTLRDTMISFHLFTCSVVSCGVACVHVLD